MKKAIVSRLWVKVMLFSAQAAPRAPRSAPKGNTKFFTWLTDSEAENKKARLTVDDAEKGFVDWSTGMGQKRDQSDFDKHA